MTRLDDAISVSMLIMIGTGLPFLTRALSVMGRADVGDYGPILIFWNSGWIPLIVFSLMVSISLVIIGWWLE